MIEGALWGMQRDLSQPRLILPSQSPAIHARHQPGAATVATRFGAAHALRGFGGVFGVTGRLW